ncbi:MAG: tRNA uridine-5-carboxymethylaminomethyl(34) synthesis GTPase MnmE [Brevinematia bacterium]
MREVFSDEDTIFAPVTPNVHSAVSVLRVSGERAIESVDKLFRGKRSLKDARTHTLSYGYIVDESGEKLDDVLVAVMRKPNSYTGEDVVEISCHGNPLIVGKVMELLKKQGLRMALPGEFTKRAVLNGKMDLLQAEAVNSLVMSRNTSNLRISRHILDGKLSERIKEVKNNLLNLLAYLEVLVDHPEEELAERNWNYIEKTILESKEVLEDLIEKSKNSRFFSEGLKICIVGRTNAGKSSLMNALIGEDRSIVSSIPGTTRDVIKEIISIEGVPVSIFDTAGIRKSEDPIEQEGVRRTIRSIETSDVVLLVLDISLKPSDEDLVALETVKMYAGGKNVFLVLNKIDLISSGFGLADVGESFSSKDSKLQGVVDEILEFVKSNNVEIAEYFLVSAKDGIGIKKLSKRIVESVIGDIESEVNNILVNNERHRQFILDVISSLEEAYESARDRMSEEFIAIGIRDALSYIGEMVGEVTTEDLMDAIFRNFCVGK